MEQDSGCAFEQHAFRTDLPDENLTPMPLPRNEPHRAIQIQAVEPIVDCGRYPVKATVGDHVDVYATVFKDGHDTLARLGARARPRRAAVRARCRSAARQRPLRRPLHRRPAGRWQFAVAAWTDRVATWQDELRRKVDAGQTDLAGELAEGAVLLGRERADRRAGPRGRRRRPSRRGRPRSALEVDVDRELARFGAWYELFPRSFGGFRGVDEVLPQLAELGFDVVYLPPIHPIGDTNRKGRNNALDAGAGRRRLAVGDRPTKGGHDALHPELGTLGGLRRARRGRGAGRRSRSRSTSRSSARPTTRG